MLNTEYLYLGGPYEGEWRRPPGVIDRPTPEHYLRGEGETGTYIPTTFAQMGDAGEFRIRFYVMLEQDLHAALITFTDPSGPDAGYRKRLERALIHQSMRAHMQRIWRVPEVLEFGPAWLAMENLPVKPSARPIRDNPQA